MEYLIILLLLTMKYVMNRNLSVMIANALHKAHPFITAYFYTSSFFFFWFDCSVWVQLLWLSVLESLRVILNLFAGVGLSSWRKPQAYDIVTEHTQTGVRQQPQKETPTNKPTPPQTWTGVHLHGLQCPARSWSRARAGGLICSACGGTRLGFVQTQDQRCVS